MKDAIKSEQEAKAEQWSRIIKSPGSRYRLGLAALMTFLTNVSGRTLAPIVIPLIIRSIVSCPDRQSFTSIVGVPPYACGPLSRLS
jgi:hypothetical protein